MNIFALAGLSLGVACLLLACLVLLFSKRKVHKLWAIFNLVVALWGLGTFFAGISNTPEKALFNWKLAYLPCTFIAIVFYHLVCVFCRLQRRKMLIFVYFQGIFFLPFIIFSNQFINSHIYVFQSFYYHKATMLFNLWVTVFCSVAFASFYELFKFIKTNSGIQKIQALYLFGGMALGWAGGLTTLLPPYNLLPVYPAWHFTICLYVPIMTYAIFRYQFMDIKIVITRTGIFIAVYSIVLGIPLTLSFSLRTALINSIGENWWMIPLISSTILATAGPFIYLYFQKKAEDKLLQEQHRYQETLSQASLGMGRVKDLGKLLKLIVHIVTRAVRLENSAIYLNDPASRQFVLSVLRGQKGDEQIPAVFIDSPLIQYFGRIKDPLVYEEIKQRAQDYDDPELKQIESVMRDVRAEVIIPSYIENRLIGILTLGKKKSGELFSQDDLTVFSILGNQAAIAIENAQFYQEMTRTHEQLFKAEKMATIGTMADGLSHQLNNRLHALGFIAGDALDSIKLKKKLKMSAEVTALIKDVEKALGKVQDHVKQGGEIVQGLLKYTRKGAEGFENVELDKLIEASLEMAQYKVKLGDIEVIKKYPSPAPAFQGNFTQLQEVFFNLIDNAYDAMMQRRDEAGEKGYKGALEFSAVKKDGYIEIYVQDNGIGVKEEDAGKLFTPFFTTKLSSKKGTGLGLYVMQKIIEDNHSGKISCSSQHMQGTRFRIRLPLRKVKRKN